MADMKLRSLYKRDRSQAIALLEKDYDSNLFQLDALEKRVFSRWYQDQWWGVFSNRTLIGVNGCFGRIENGSPARLLLPYGEDDAMKLFGEFEKERGGTSMILGARRSADLLIEGLKYTTYKTFYNQRIYRCTKIVKKAYHSDIQFQKAKMNQEDQIISLSAQMMIEDLGKDPRVPDPKKYRETIRRRIQEGRCFIGMLKNEIVFLLDLGTNGSRGCQIGGTYVPKEHRGKGVATEGVHYWTEKLIQKFGLVTLHVNEENNHAIRCYQKVGFQQSSPYRLAIVDLLS